MLRVLDPVFMSCTMLHASIAAFVLGNRDPGTKTTAAHRDRDAHRTVSEAGATGDAGLHSTDTLLSSGNVWRS